MYRFVTTLLVLILVVAFVLFLANPALALILVGATVIFGIGERQ